MMRMALDHIESKMDPQCEICKFWEQDDDESSSSGEDGYCVRFPPRGEEWSRTEKFHSCGEFSIDGERGEDRRCGLRLEWLRVCVPKHVWKEISKIEELGVFTCMESSWREDDVVETPLSLEVASWIVFYRIEMSLPVDEDMEERTREYRMENESKFDKYR